MGLLDRFTPQQKQLAVIGVPAVAAFALISKIGKPAAADASNSEDAGPAGSSGWTMPSTDAIGTGQLAEFESLVTARLNDLSVKTEETGIYTGSLTDQLAGQISGLSQQFSTLSAPPPPPAETYPAPPPVVAPAPVCPAAPAPGIPGEVVIKRLDAPGGGCWYITNFGGVYAMAGAPFKGSCVGACRTGPGYEDPPRYMVDAANLGSGYQMWSNRGEHYAFP